jgi:uncharacterized protein YggE
MKYVVMMLAMLLAVPAMADEDVLRQIQVTGEAKASFVPDAVQIAAEVSAQNLSLEVAKKEHDTKLRALLKLQDKYGLEDKYLDTQSARIQPQYRWVNNTQKFEGYIVSTTVAFTLRKIDQAGAFLQDAVAVNPQSLNGPSYFIYDPKPLRDDVRLAAVKDAREKAQKLAAELGMKPGKPLVVSEQYQSAPQPVVMRKMEMAPQAMAMGGAPVAAPAGEQEINAQIYITFELKD